VPSGCRPSSARCTPARRRSRSRCSICLPWSSAPGLRRLELDLALLDVPTADADISTLTLFPGDPLALSLLVHHVLAKRPRVEPAELAGRTLLTPPRSVDPRFHDWLVQLVARAGYGFADFAEHGGRDVRDLLFAVAEGRGIAIAALSLRTIAGDVGNLVTTRPLDPPLSMPDSRLAWRGDTPKEIATAASRCRSRRRARRARPARAPARRRAADGRRAGRTPPVARRAATTRRRC
jgi:hypothetical protein